MQTDTIKLISSHTVAVVLAVGGPILIVWLFINGNSIEGVEGIQAMLGAFVGAAIQFLFQTNAMAAARGQTRADLLTNP